MWKDHRFNETIPLQGAEGLFFFYLYKIKGSEKGQGGIIVRGQTYVIVAIIFVILVAIFAVMNVSPVQVTYFFWQVESPLILVILFSGLMGGMITAAVGMVRMFKLQKEIKVIRRKNAALSQLVEDKNVAETNGGTQASKANDGTQED